jgi:hypothetical protein
MSLSVLVFQGPGKVHIKAAGQPSRAVEVGRFVIELDHGARGSNFWIDLDGHDGEFEAAHEGTELELEGLRYKDYEATAVIRLPAVERLRAGVARGRRVLFGRTQLVDGARCDDLLAQFGRVGFEVARVG